MYVVLLEPTNAAFVPVAAPAAVPVNQVMDVPSTTVHPLAARVEVAFSNPPSLALIREVWAYAGRKIPEQHAIIRIVLDKRVVVLLIRVGLRGR